MYCLCFLLAFLFPQGWTIHLGYISKKLTTFLKIKLSLFTVSQVSVWFLTYSIRTSSVRHWYPSGLRGIHLTQVSFPTLDSSGGRDHRPTVKWGEIFGAGKDSWESLGLQGDQTSQSFRKSTLNIHWRDCCWSWSSNTLATWGEEPTHWKRLWCLERLRAKGKGGSRGWDGWMASLTQWTWVWANSRRWWRTGKPGVLQSMCSPRVRHDLGTEQQ